MQDEPSAESMALILEIIRGLNDAFDQILQAATGSNEVMSDIILSVVMSFAVTQLSMVCRQAQDGVSVAEVEQACRVFAQVINQQTEKIIERVKSGGLTHGAG